MENREMLDEYFSLLITEDGIVVSLPMLLKGYTPNLDRLPHFLLCLGARVSDLGPACLLTFQVDWTSEKPCFESFLQELAFFYSPRPLGEPGDSLDQRTAEERDHERWQLEHVLFPSFRKYTVWPRKFADQEVRQIANLPDLFKIFERC
jgi:DNA mismatch repair protein MLH1